MPAITPEQSESLVERGLDLLRDAADLTSGSDPNYIRDAQPTSLFEALPLAAARQGCRRYADQGDNYPARRAARAERACRPYLDSLEYGEGPKLEKPITGGQCPVPYRVTYSVRSRTSNQFTCGTFGDFTQDDRITPSSPTPIGPITNYRQVITNVAGVNGTDREVSYRFDAANGSFALSLGGSATRPFKASCGVSREVTNVNFIRADGQPEDCAPVPPVYTPPVPPVGGPGPRVEPFNPSPDINVDIGVEVNPDLTINIDFGTGPITIDPFGDAPGSGGGDAPGPLDPEVGDPIDSLPGAGGGGNDTGFGEPPEGRIWVGAYVQLLGDLAPFGVIPRDLVGQSALSTVVGNASLNVATDSSTILRSTFTQIRSEWSEHIVPVIGLPVTGIRVKVNPALGYRVYPVSVADPLAEST